MMSESAETFSSTITGEKRKYRSNYSNLKAFPLHVPLSVPELVFLLAIVCFWAFIRCILFPYYYFNRSLLSNADFIFDQVVIDNEAILLKSKSQYKSTGKMLPLQNITSVRIHDVCVNEDTLTGRTKVFDFTHVWGPNELLRYDIQDRDRFIKILAQNGVSVDQDS